MKRWIVLALLVLLLPPSAALAQQPSSDDQRALRTRLEQRFDVVPLTDGVALRPKSPMRDVRLIEITEGSVLVNGVAVTGQELRDGCGAGGALADDPDFVARISAIEVRIMALEHAELETLARVSAGESPGPNSSLLKNLAVDIEQEVELTRLEAIQYYGLVHPRAREHLPRHAQTATAKYLNGRAASIYGGSKEVQKNIIATRGLGLPRG